MFIFQIFAIIPLIVSFNYKLILNFETKDIYPLNNDNFFNIKYYNEPSTYLKIGSQKEEIPFYITTNSEITFIAGKESKIKEGLKKYNEENSSKYLKKREKIYFNSFYVYSYISEDQISLNLDKEINNQEIIFDFHLAISRAADLELQQSAILGLGYMPAMFYTEDYNFDSSDIKDEENEEIDTFISQMKEKGIISKQIFFFNYKDNNNGELIVGEYPHEYNPINYKLSDYIEIENNYVDDLNIVWSLSGFSYYGKNLIYEYLSTIEFCINQGLIIGSTNYKNVIFREFFEKKIENEECFEKFIEMNFECYIGYYCKKEVDIREIKNLEILIDKIKYKIEFSYDELFYKINEYIFFMVIFPIESSAKVDSGFTLGEPFFKKYPLVFNTDGLVEKIGFYYGTTNDYFLGRNNMNKDFDQDKANMDENEDKKNEKNSVFNNVNKRLILILIIMGLIIIGLIVIIIKFSRCKRKPRLNELTDFLEEDGIN